MVVFTDGLKASAVIFDFDGVIVDTEPLHYKAFQRILEPIGLGFSWEDYVLTYMGFDDRDAFTAAFQSKNQLLSQSELNKLVEKKASVFQDVILDGVTAYPGVVELISRLHANKIPLAICSGALLSDIVPILRLLNISSFFNTIITADDVQKSKPDPESYRMAFQKLQAIYVEDGLSLTDTIAIEDTPAGIKSAVHAGLKVIAVTNSYPKETLSDATNIVNSLEFLLEFKLT